MDRQPPALNDKRTKAMDEKFCSTCGEIIKIKAEICPHCGVRQKGQISKAALMLFAFFLGGIGAHKFYTGKYWQGIFYILFCWTGIPGLIALIEFIIYAFTSRERLQEKYSANGGGVVIAVIACGIGFIFITGILAAIAIPQFVTYRHRAYQASVKAELQSLSVAQNVYFEEHGRYSTNLSELNLESNPMVTLEILSADDQCFEAIGEHEKLEDTLTMDCNGLQ
ncbi:MAG: NINE protein [Proteobacteria bacterium]|nr:NINE protein [Pseudomonadota bacterium]